MKAINTLVAAMAHNRPVAEMAYVAVVAICDLDDGPGIDVIIRSDAIAPAAKTHRLPRGSTYGLVDHQTFEPRGAQTLVAARGQGQAGSVPACEQAADEIRGDDPPVELTRPPELQEAVEIQISEDEVMKFQRQAEQIAGWQGVGMKLWR